MNFKKLTSILSASVLAMSIPAAAQASFSLDAAQRGPAIGNLHYGIFFEEINFAGDGGLYAELVSNRSFEDATTPKWWNSSVGASMKIVGSDLNNAQTNALEVSFTRTDAYINNQGFWGMNIVSGQKYKVSFFVKAPAGYNSTIKASLASSSGSDLGNVSLNVAGTGAWEKVSGEIIATGSDAKGSFRLTPAKKATLTFDVVSLFPPTYKDRPNGCRIDLAEKLKALKPAFVRFPGGCYVEGEWSNGSTNRFEWKNTIGPIETRRGHMNVPWKYRVSDGLGLHEMLQLTEDLGAEPLFVCNIGLGHGWTAPYNEIGEYLQECLDLLEYCNGDVTTKWGAVRAANGHPEPFNLRLIEVGNENYQAGSDARSDHYAERYIQFYNAIKAVHPEAIVIGDVEAWGTDNPSWRNNHPVDAVDEHYYRSPDWFKGCYAKYDAYDRRGPKVYVGEYAVTQNYGTNGNLEAALGEAIYMCGMERNSDHVVMNSYAPIFINENVLNDNTINVWRPDMIRFNASQSYGTPSYYVQQLMPNSKGKVNLKISENGNLNAGGHKVGFSTWATTVKYDNVKVSNLDGSVVFTDDFSNANEWNLSSGWNTNGGALNMTDGSKEGGLVYCAKTCPDNFIFEFDATKVSGKEGFLVAFNVGDQNNYVWFNVAGWNNTQHAIEICSNGAKSTFMTAGGSITTGKTYHGKIVLNGTHVVCSLDDQVIFDCNLPIDRKVYTTASIDDEAGLVYFRAVNYTTEDQAVSVDLANCDLNSAESTVLGSTDRMAENTTSNPNNIVPVQGSVAVSGNKLTFTAPANSLTIVRASVSNIRNEGGASLSAAVKAEVEAELASTGRLLKNLHASTTLPSSTSNGCTLTWRMKAGAQGVGVLEGVWSSRLEVEAAKRDKSVNAGTLVATATDATGAKSDIEFPVVLAPSDKGYGYLYCFMNPGQEITNFALGTKEDKGKVFNVILGGREVFNTAQLAAIEGGTRDAFLLRGHKDNQYLMTTTDMCNRKSGVWNNYGLDILRSTDLMHWESTVFDFRKGKSIFSDPTATTDVYKTDAEYAKINRVWAPQVIWDKDANGGKGAYLVYYSVLSSNSGDNHDRIVYSYADEDFKTLTQPRVFYDPGFSVIDGDIVLNEYDGLYHMWLKHEGAGGKDAGIYELTSDRLVGGTWKETNHITNEGTAAVEGSSTYRRIDEDIYNIGYMRYSEGYEYKVCESDHEGQRVTSSQKLAGNGSFQHGSFVIATEEEYKMLQAWDELDSRLSWAKGTNSPAFDEAIAKGEAALKNTTVSSLLAAMTEALDAIDKSYLAYVQELANRNNGDITKLISNPDFNAATGWKGTTFTAVSNGVGEFWSTNYDAYQILPDMPAGTYTLSCSGFYRNGNRDAYNLHVNGTEKLNAMLYLGENETPFMSLFDDAATAKAGYKYSPYSYPDNVSTANDAFNNKKVYGGNTVVYTLSAPGDLRLGVRKTVACGSDWNCFDNFKLLYNSSTQLDATIVDSPDTTVNVYSSTGILLRSNVRNAVALKDMPAGIYIVGNRKVIVK